MMLQRWKVTGIVEAGSESRMRVLFVDAESRDEAQHVARERMMAAEEAFAGAAYMVEPVEGKGWR